jgi:hypothetical protein
MKIKILEKHYIYDTSEGSGDGSSWIDHNISGAIKVNESKFYDLEVDDKFLNKEVYLLYILYTNGSSDSTTTGNIEYIDCFETSEKAEEVEKIIEDDYEKNRNWNFRENGMDLFYTKENGNKCKIPTYVYKGYFERLDSVCIQKILIKNKEVKHKKGE